MTHVPRTYYITPSFKAEELKKSRAQHILSSAGETVPQMIAALRLIFFLCMPYSCSTASGDSYRRLFYRFAVIFSEKVMIYRDFPADQSLCLSLRFPFSNYSELIKLIVAHLLYITSISYVNVYITPIKIFAVILLHPVWLCVNYTRVTQAGNKHVNQL